MFCGLDGCYTLIIELRLLFLNTFLSEQSFSFRGSVLGYCHFFFCLTAGHKLLSTSLILGPVVRFLKEQMVANVYLFLKRNK